MTDTVRRDIYDECKRDRDRWRRAALAHKSEAQHLAIRLAEANRALIEAQRNAARRHEIESMFTG